MRNASRPVPACAAAALLVLSAACGDATAPRKTVRVSVNVSSIAGPVFSETANHEPLVGCRVTLQAVATGDGTARWGAAKLLFYIGPHHQSLVDSATFTAEEIGPSWDQYGRITGGQTQVTYWNLQAAVPFYVTVQYHYTPPNRGEDSTSTSFWCGESAVASARAPTITSLSITPPSGELAAGAPLTVTFSAEAPAGLWRTDIVVSGPCEATMTFNELLKTTTSHTVAVPIPGTCPLGVPITVDVYALDGLVQSGQRRLVSSVVLADHEPPELVVGGGMQYFKGDFFGGDNINIGFSARDNHGLSAIVWEIAPAGVRDSILFSGPVIYGLNANIHLPQDLSGNVQIRFFARDQQGLESAVQTTLADSIRVHPTIVHPARVATFAGDVRGFAVDSRRNSIYLSDATHRQIAILSMATMQITARVDVAGTPEDLDITPSGDSLVVALPDQRTLGIVDLRGPAPVATTMLLPWLDPATSQTPIHVRVGANGRAYLTLRASNGAAQTMNEVDLATGAARTLPGAATNGGLAGGELERSFDASVLAVRVYYDCLRRYDVIADAFSACTYHNQVQTKPTLDATGAHVAEALDIFDASMRLLATVKGLTNSAYPAITLLPDGGSMYVSKPGHVVRVRSSDGAILEQSPDPVQPSELRMSADGRSLISFASFAGTTQIAVIDLH